MPNLLQVNVKRKKYLFRYELDLKGQKDKAVPRKITIGTFSKAIDYAPYYIAKSKSLFETLGGIQIEYKSYNSIEAINRALIDHELDIICEAEQPVFVTQNQGIPLKIVGINASLTQETIVHTNSAIHKISDLKNKRIGVLKGTSSHYGVLRFLEQHTIDHNRVTLVDMNPEKGQKEFEEKKIDAWAVWPPYTEEQIIKNNARILEGGEVYIASIIAAREDFILNHKNLLLDLLEVFVRAKKWIKKNEIEAQKIVSEETETPLEIVKLAWSRHDFTINIFTNVVLANVSFTLEENKFTTILGPSGCGKSTLLKIISGLDQDYHGEILLKGEKVLKPIKQISMMFQEHRLLPWLTVNKNILFGLQHDNQNEVDKLLTLLGLEKFKNNYPSQLSGGMAQRVALARALVNIPGLLLTDEPFASLDMVTKRNLQDEVLKMVTKKSASALMVTHDIAEAVYLSDRILIMTSRPAGIIKNYIIDLPRPRNRISKEFVQLVDNIFSDMKKEFELI